VAVIVDCYLVVGEVAVHDLAVAAALCFHIARLVPAVALATGVTGEP
jgi:hypothetical protein